MRSVLLCSLAPLLASFVLVGGCASVSREQVAVDAIGVAVIGVSLREGVRGINRSTAARDLARRLEEGGRRRVVSPGRAREALGEASREALLERHARSGLIEERDVRALVAAPLDTRFALFARIERDEVRELEPRSEPVRDDGGRTLSDRVRIERATRRDTELSAVLVDLHAARVVWLRRYAAAPVTRGESVRYRGSSFTGSVAALLANRLVSGTGSPDAPPPASRRATLERLFDEIERSLPVR